MNIILEDRVSELERRVRELEARALPAGWQYYPPLVFGPGDPVVGPVCKVMTELKTGGEA